MRLSPKGKLVESLRCSRFLSFMYISSSSSMMSSSISRLLRVNGAGSRWNDRQSPRFRGGTARRPDEWNFFVGPGSNPPPEDVTSPLEKDDCEIRILVRLDAVVLVVEENVEVEGSWFDSGWSRFEGSTSSEGQERDLRSEKSHKVDLGSL